MALNNKQGAGTWGYPGTQSRIEDLETAQTFIDVMLAHDHTGIDTAQNYGNGTSEKVSPPFNATRPPLICLRYYRCLEYWT